jgi:hypothetical protein
LKIADDLKKLGAVYRSFFKEELKKIKMTEMSRAVIYSYFESQQFGIMEITGLQINLYLEQPMEIQLFPTFFQRRK